MQNECTNKYAIETVTLYNMKAFDVQINVITIVPSNNLTLISELQTRNRSHRQLSVRLRRQTGRAVPPRRRLRIRSGVRFVGRGRVERLHGADGHSEAVRRGVLHVQRLRHWPVSGSSANRIVHVARNRMWRRLCKWRSH